MRISVLVMVKNPPNGPDWVKVATFDPLDVVQGGFSKSALRLAPGTMWRIVDGAGRMLDQGVISEGRCPCCGG